MLIDNATITIHAGDGGRGAVAFNSTLKNLGPTGGDGGRGGSIYFEGVSDLSALAQFRYKKEIVAKNGENGKRQNNDGHDADNVIVKVPVGTVIRTVEVGNTQEILSVGERILAAEGGRGGKGNFKFRSPTNTSPKQFTEGTPGEQFTLELELKLIADVGLVGLPNAGKSSLLNELTRAKSRVAAYPFTTLEPHLGTYYELVLADIPGLIEGASGGKGLGIKFLKHIERTKIIFHLVAVDSDNPARDYKVVLKELKSYSKELADRPTYVLLTKSDTVSPSDLKKKISALKKIAKTVLPVSIHDWESLEKIRLVLNKIKDEKLKTPAKTQASS
ncbi:MAG: GTPase ObgE [Patescibacteria group bacterium]